MGLNWTLHQDKTTYLVVKAELKDASNNSSVVRKDAVTISAINNVASFSAVDQHVLIDNYLYVSVPSGTSNYATYFTSGKYKVDYERFAPIKLGSLSDKKDSLFRQDGAWYVRKLVEKDVVLDGSLAWTFGVDGVGYKRANVVISGALGRSGVITKYDGRILRNMQSTPIDGSDQHNGIAPSDSVLNVSISDIETGFGETYSPTADEIKSYFNGWQAKTVDGNGKPTAWRSLGDGTDAPTQTLAYVKDNKAPNFTPYKLSYLLATPQLVNVSEKVEGDVALNGQTQVSVDSGFIVEKVTFDSGTKRATTSKPSRSILSVRKGSTKEPFKTYTSNGQTLPELLNAVDTNQTYYVVYQTDKHTVTNNPVDLKAIYSSNFKGVLDKTVESVSDNTTQISIHTKLLVEIMARLKAGNI